MKLPPLPRGSRRGAGYIYFMLADDGLARPMVKIGFSLRSPDSRLAACQTGSPVRLALIAFVAGAILAEERDLHKRFKEHHSHGEWFFFEDGLRDYVEELVV